MTRKFIIADLYCGEGGAGKGLHDAGFEVVGFDINPKCGRRYPFEFRCQDALTVDLSEFDAVWASPPCQFNLKGLNAVNIARGRKLNHVDLIADTRDHLKASGLPYVIENVEGARARMHQPVMLCGSAFGLAVRRHRLFEASFVLFALDCAHYKQDTAQYPTSFRPGGRIIKSKVVQVYGNTAGSHLWPEAMGIDWMDRHGLQQAIPPAYSEYLGKQLFTILERMNEAAA